MNDQYKPVNARNGFKSLPLHAGYAYFYHFKHKNKKNIFYFIDLSHAKKIKQTDN